MRRLLVNSVSLFCIVVAGVLLYVATISTPGSLNVFARLENVVWVVIVSLIAFGRAKVECCRSTSNSWYGALFEWCATATTGNILLFWLDVIVNPKDDFKTMLGFGCFIFLIPSVLLSAIVYSIARKC